MTLREEVARVLCRSSGRYVSHDGDPWDVMLMAHERDRFLRAADAAIAVCRRVHMEEAAGVAAKQAAIIGAAPGSSIHSAIGCAVSAILALANPTTEEAGS